ncbi:MAG: riboflavin biosynthesis protein RibF [Candidatus Omnitrophica bacterium]|nr:riboflavin biosynthesis protein RibF [Candidatus Omnitrophota bacterium]
MSAPIVAAIGIFDGVHRGHRRILAKAVERARRLKGAAVAVTFDPHPLAVLNPPQAPSRLISLEDRLQAFAGCGVQAAVVIRFTRSFSRWSPERFVREVLVRRLAVSEVVVGHDFRFGVRRAGTPDTLRALGKKQGFRTWVIPPFRSGKERISSRRIRELIAMGDLRRAARYLGRPVSIQGRVVRGAGRGARLGFATANLKVESGLLPPVGVYAVEAGIDGCERSGMANIGFRPTFKKVRSTPNSSLPTPPLLEVHLFKIRKSLYGKLLAVRFLQRLRSERKFRSPEALRRQLQADARQAKRVFALQARRRMV